MTTNWMMILVKKVFTFFSPKSSVCHARLRAGLFIQETAYGGLSYKVKKDLTGSFCRIHKVLGFICQSRYASAAPSSLQFATPASSGISLQMTLSVARTAPASLQLFSQFLIHSPSPHP